MLLILFKHNTYRWQTRCWKWEWNCLRL